MKPVGSEFIKATSMVNCSASPQSQGAPQPPLELPLEPGLPCISLPSPAELDIPSADLKLLAERRRTLRRYRKEPLSLHELSYLLWLSQGVKEVTPRPVTLRTVPSAGARHAFETYLLVNRVDGLDAGLYHFAASQHALLQLDAGQNMSYPDLLKSVTHACMDQVQITNSAVTFLWAAVVERMTWRYVERGYRYLFLDAGHVCQNLYLAAEAVNCGTCAIAAYDDDLLNQALGFDGENIFVIYLASVGKR
jgi:SagB-type dehydrogenase family enzyme